MQDGIGSLVLCHHPFNSAISEYVNCLSFLVVLPGKTGAWGDRFSCKPEFDWKSDISPGVLIRTK
jgi:hypothetical protein